MEWEEQVWERADDPDRFARVWKRAAGPNSPVEALATVQPAEAAPAAPREEYPLGEGSARYGAFLRERVLAELRAWKRCLRLAGTGRGSALMKGLAGEKLGLARRLSAAYFLITGIRWFPREAADPGRWSTREQGLRELFRACQQGESAYRRAAADTADPALSVLFLELAREESGHQRRILTVLEVLEP